MIQPGTSVRVILQSFRSGEPKELLSGRVYVVARIEGDLAWIQDGAGGTHRIAVRLLVAE